MRQTITEDNFFDEKGAIAKIEIGTIPEVINYFTTSAEQGEQQRITVLSWLYTFQKRTPIIIGEILLSWERKIKKNYDNTKKYQEKTGTQGELPAKNLYDWFNKNPDKLPFGYKEARHYMSYRTDREQILLEAPEKLDKDIPIKHNTIIRQIKDPEVREKVREKIAEEGLTAEKTKEIVNKVNEKIEKKEVFQKAKKKVTIDVKVKGNTIVLEFQNQTHRDIANEYILMRLEAIKQRIIDAG